jgi:hypothetical protein
MASTNCSAINVHECAHPVPAGRAQPTRIVTILIIICWLSWHGWSAGQLTVLVALLALARD